MWSLGVLIGGPILALVILTAATLTALAFRWRRGLSPNDYDRGMSTGLSFGGLAVVVLLVILGACSYYPYSADYHRWNETGGTVAKVSSRLLGGDSSITQRFVVRFTDGRERACDDTRCSLLKPGDHLTLSCKRHWQYAGEDGWDCNYIGRQS